MHQAGGLAVEDVEDVGDNDRGGGNLKVPFLHRNNGKKPAEQVPHRKQIRQNVDSAYHGRIRRFLCMIIFFDCCH